MDKTPIIIAIIPPLFALLSLIATGFISILALKINKKVNDAKQTNDDTNISVNSSLEMQLKNTMDVANKAANISECPNVLIESADATRLYQEHLAKHLLADKPI